MKAIYRTALNAFPVPVSDNTIGEVGSESANGSTRDLGVTQIEASKGWQTFQVSKAFVGDLGLAQPQLFEIVKLLQPLQSLIADGRLRKNHHAQGVKLAQVVEAAVGDTSVLKMNPLESGEAIRQPSHVAIANREVRQADADYGMGRIAADNLKGAGQVVEPSSQQRITVS